LKNITEIEGAVVFAWFGAVHSCPVIIKQKIPLRVMLTSMALTKTVSLRLLPRFSSLNAELAYPMRDTAAHENATRDVKIQ
jgi:hypothetical protein